LTQEREQAKKTNDQLEELSKMKGSQQIIDAISKSEEKVLGLITVVKADVNKLQTDVTQVKQNQGLLVMELKTRGVISETPIIK
jgi:hypothetical protein